MATGRRYGSFAGRTPTISAALTGTITESVSELDIVLGGRTLILTLTNDTWVAAGATFNGQRQAILDGITSAQAEATGWNAVVRDLEPVGSVVRTSDTVVTITWSASGTYDITAQETITATIPTAALSTAASPVVATPTFTISVHTPAAVVVGGDDAPAKRKKQKTQDELFRDIATTIHQLLAGEPAVEAAPVVLDAPGATMADKLEAAFSKLVLLTAEQDDWTSKIAELRTALNRYQQQMWDEDDAEWLFFM